MNIITRSISSRSRSAAASFAAVFATIALAESPVPPVAPAAPSAPSHAAPHAPSRAPSHAAQPSTATPSAPARYTSPHWRLDNRYHHDRYYPARGYVVGTLPVGHIGVTFGGVRYYHHAGVWFRARGPRYVVIAPPFGIIIPILPYGYSTLWWRNEPYYYADDVYYVRAPGGYRVIEAPPIDEVIVEDQPPTSVTVTSPPTARPVAPVVAQQPAAPSVTGNAVPTPTYAPSAVAATPETLFVYPKGGQTATQTSFDRIECDRWAVGQTGFEPSQPSADPARRGGFLRAVAACLEGRGYTVK